MPNDRACYFDQTTRDYHHELRRIQVQQTRFISNWFFVFWFVINAAIVAIFLTW